MCSFGSETYEFKDKLSAHLLPTKLIQKVWSRNRITIVETLIGKRADWEIHCSNWSTAMRDPARLALGWLSALEVEEILY